MQSISKLESAPDLRCFVECVRAKRCKNVMYLGFFFLNYFLQRGSILDKKFGVVYERLDLFSLSPKKIKNEISFICMYEQYDCKYTDKHIFYMHLHSCIHASTTSTHCNMLFT